MVITGGEPFRQDLAKLLNVLTDAGYYVQIETNGTLEPADVPYSLVTDIRTGVYVVCSPKAGKVHPRIAEVACCYKYVLSQDSIHADGLPLRALEHTASPFVARPPKPHHNHNGHGAGPSDLHDLPPLAWLTESCHIVKQL